MLTTTVFYGMTLVALDGLIFTLIVVILAWDFPEADPEIGHK